MVCFITILSDFKVSIIFTLISDTYMLEGAKGGSVGMPRQQQPLVTLLQRENKGKRHLPFLPPTPDICHRGDCGETYPPLDQCCAWRKQTSHDNPTWWHYLVSALSSSVWTNWGGPMYGAQYRGSRTHLQMEFPHCMATYTMCSPWHLPSRDPPTTQLLVWFLADPLVWRDICTLPE